MAGTSCSIRTISHWPSARQGRYPAHPPSPFRKAGVPWFLDLRELLEANTGTPHFDFSGAIRARIASCAKKEPLPLFFTNSSKIADNLAFDPHDRPVPAAIPVLYLTAAAKRKYLKDESGIG